jgi:hypothetical protein
VIHRFNELGLVCPDRRNPGIPRSSKEVRALIDQHTDLVGTTADTLAVNGSTACAYFGAERATDGTTPAIGHLPTTPTPPPPASVSGVPSARSERWRSMERDKLMLSEAEGRLVADRFLQASRKPSEPELAVDWELVRVKEGILIAPYNSTQFLASRNCKHQLLDCWPILVDLSSGSTRFGNLDERSFWKGSS